MQEDYILTINGGSSSIKFALFEHETLRKVFHGKIDRIGMHGTYIQSTDIQSGKHIKNQVTTEDPVQLLIETISAHNASTTIRAIGHRVVHGGTMYTETTRIDSTTITTLKTLAPFAPRHLPAEITLLESLLKQFPDTPQYACFDTSFYRSLPRIAQIIPLPHTYERDGVRRYGFHGLSYEYIMKNLEEVFHIPVTEKKIVLAHLGSGASLVAVQNGRPVDMSMGFTPNSGIPMGTRSGDLDPGLFEYFTQTRGMTPAQFDHMVNFDSGTLGISGSTADMEVLLTHASKDTRAENAVAFFCHNVRKYIGALTAVMGGIDILVFTGGMGEKSPDIRKRICTGLEYLGIQLDPITNTACNSCISDATSRVILYMIPTDEEYMIALHTKEST